ncbi:cobyric acid synthase [Pontibaca methylaminivorans]|uniref:Cobyric acid synthase n=1 Tax=Pontibaca methylaminivorans TaxID=515897 RepID=A0A1R3WD29_9RHOB|nr:cobyric acid synthase [Pontibaca methylaminivorans]SIT75783.1 adenosylcobyric acid synthase (glutamine-hydrolysing) [Pontibaca methylaminivorans]
MPAVMIQGTGSDVGKSLLVAGLCRAARRRRITVLPFKPQNMSNNTRLSAAGHEVATAQALQALACGAAADSDMSPVLLKPRSETGSQVVVQGRPLGAFAARDYARLKPQLLDAVLASFARLQARAELVIVEGAGSAAEVNLRRGDIANMGFARAAGVPVVLTGDIDRGGVIAQIVGTRAVLDPQDAGMVHGFIINRFRGDPDLFREGCRMIEERSGWRSFGVLPWFSDARLLPAEDTLALSSGGANAGGGGRLRICCLALPRIAGFDALDPLRLEPDVRFSMVQPGEAIPEVALVIIPDSAAPQADLAVLRAEGWDVDLRAHHRRGGRILGLGAGRLMLGQRLAEPGGADVPGLGLSEADAADGRIEGMARAEVLADDGFRRRWLSRLGATPVVRDWGQMLDEVLDRLAEHVEAHLDVSAIFALAQQAGAGVAERSAPGAVRR